jgi:hypothetical protein
MISYESAYTGASALADPGAGLLEYLVDRFRLCTCGPPPARNYSSRHCLCLGIAYGAGAYLILSRAVRMGLKILQRKRVPSFTVTGDGLPGDPVNVALSGTLQQLVRPTFAACQPLHYLWANHRRRA